MLISRINRGSLLYNSRSLLLIPVIGWSMRLLSILAGVGVPHLRRPMPMIIVHLHSESNGGSDTRHSALSLYQEAAVTLTLPLRHFCPRDSRAVLHVMVNLWIPWNGKPEADGLA